MFVKKLLICLSGLVLGLNLMVNAQNKNVPSTLTAVTWKIDQLYLDTIPVAKELIDSLRYKFETTGMVTLNKVGFPGISQPYTYKTGNKGNTEFTINFKDIPAETYEVVKLSAHMFIFFISKLTSAGTTSKLEYRMVPE